MTARARTHKRFDSARAHCFTVYVHSTAVAVCVRASVCVRVCVCTAAAVLEPFMQHDVAMHVFNSVLLHMQSKIGGGDRQADSISPPR